MKTTKRPTYVSWDQLPVVFDVPIAAVVLGLSSASVKNFARDGKIPGARKIGDQWRFDKESLRAWITGAVPA